MGKPGRKGGAPPLESGVGAPVHPALSALTRNDGGFAVGAPRDPRTLRAPDNLTGERDILRFALCLFSALALLEEEGWPFRPSAARWALAEDDLPALAGFDSDAAGSPPGLDHGALLARLLTGKRASPEGPWPTVSRRHSAASAWNAWLAGLKRVPPGCSMRSHLQGLWSLAGGAGISPGLPSPWGVGISWSPAAFGGGLHTLAADGGHALQAILTTLPDTLTAVGLGGAPPYPYAALEPLVAEALGKDEARSWMGKHLGRGEKAFADALGTLLGRSGKGWVLHPSEALDETSLRVLEGCLERAVPDRHPVASRHASIPARRPCEPSPPALAHPRRRGVVPGARPRLAGPRRRVAAPGLGALPGR